MLTDWELWAFANYYITHYGDDAAIKAAMRCDELLDAQDIEGARNYQAIIERIMQLLDSSGGPVH